MMILKMLAGPVIGAVIGYFTNYIAVKMLFRPHHPKFIGKKQLPFTPGMIPKRKDQLAAAVGKAVSEKLLTGEDLALAMPADTIKNTVADKVWSQYEKLQAKEETIESTAVRYITQEKYDEIRLNIEDTMTEKVVEAIGDMHVGELIVKEGTRIINEKAKGTMLEMFLNEQNIRTIAEPIGEEIEKFLGQYGEMLVRPAIQTQIIKVETSTVAHLTERIPLERKNILKLVDTVYERCMADSIQNIMESVDIAGIIENKIREMDVERLEELVLSVMKKELDAIVNLGALIGFVIGMLNLLINLI